MRKKHANLVKIKKKKQKATRLRVDKQTTAWQSASSFYQKFFNNYNKAFRFHQTYFHRFWKNGMLGFHKRNYDIVRLTDNFGESGLLNCGPCNPVNINQEDSNSQYDDDYEVSDELLKFLQERIKQKSAKEKKEFVEEENTLPGNEASNSFEGNTSDNKEDIDEGASIKHTRIMKILYGDEFAKICGMETALQVTFNYKINKSCPPFWPVYPLSFPLAQK